MKGFFGQMLASMLGYFAGTVLLFIFGLFVIMGIAAGSGKKKPVAIKDNSILKIQLTGKVDERASSNDFSFTGFGDDKGFSLDEMVAVLRTAAKDDKIKGIYLDMGMLQSGMASLASIRKELIEFKKSKKFIYAYGEMMTEKSFYLASVADSIFLYPTGAVEWNGLSANPMFLRGMLDKWHVEPRVFKVGKFKSAAEMFSERQLSDMNRLQLQVMLNDLWDHMLISIAEGRKMNKADLDGLASQMTVTRPKDAVKYKLVDAALHPDEVEEILKKRVKKVKKEDKLEWTKYSDYAKNVSIKKDKTSFNNKVAIVYAVGDIVSGEGDEDTMGSETICKAIREAREDEGVKAIVLRVNSPGGSALASDVIAREVQITKKIKPVIASYGDVAASGGYYISAGCDRIFAEPTTITGSIGVIGLLMNTQAFFNQELGITFDRVYSSENQYADIGNPNKTMSDYEAQKIQQGVNEIYGDFIEVVRSGRKFADSVAVDSIAQGRIWSGNRALTLKLVDEIGSLDDAIKLAAKKAGLGEKDYSVAEYPKHKGFIEKLLEGMQSRSEASIINQVLPKEHQQLYQTLKSLADPRGIYMKEFWVDLVN